MAEPDRIALGLTSQTLSCDRTERRFEAADGALLTPWRLWATANHVPQDILDALHHDGSRPGTWLVATDPVPIVVRVRVSP